MSPILVATGREVRVIDPLDGSMRQARGLEGMVTTCLAADELEPGRAWCGTKRHGVRRSDDGGLSWRDSGLAGTEVTAVCASRVEPGLVWVGTEPSALWRSEDGGVTWDAGSPLTALPSAPTWSFPPRPDTHHVRWIEEHPRRAGRLWIAVEAGALVSSDDGGRRWTDRVPGGPYDTHELAVHPDRPDRLQVAAGDGFYLSGDGGVSWTRPMEGLDVGYLRSVAIDPGDPETVVVSASSAPRRAYVAGSADGRVYRRVGSGDWMRVLAGWPSGSETIAPLLRADARTGSLWAADERGLHRSTDAGLSFTLVHAFDPPPGQVRGLAITR